MSPIEISDPASGLEAAFVQRYAIESLSEPWRREDLCGIYLLLDDIQFTSGFKAYVGYTYEGFDGALQERNERSSFWSTALLFSNHDGENLTPEQVDRLEREVVRLLSNGQHIKLQNVEAPEGDPLTGLDEPARDIIDDMALFVVRVMFLQGYRSASLAKAVHPIEAHAEELHPPAD